ncbi:GNAT family N-acetyltransferase [Streptomyces sp. NPDC060194]|uniref:GNAT family N-acetyltransferase n=1 Tax=Streptomyces sp. NPDC060194 TaxID=3347069 RepID=UPI00364A293E
MLLRPAVESELDVFLPLIVTDPVSPAMSPANYRAKLATGEYRPEWTWLAEEDDGRVVAVAVWWGPSAAQEPGALDGVFVADSVGVGEQRVAVAAELLRTAHDAFAKAGQKSPPAFHIFLPGDWRDRPEVGAELGWRREAAERVGLTAELERLRYEWTADAGLPAASPRLRFRPETDDEVFVDLFRQVLDGSLDAGSLQEAEELGAEAYARADVAFYRDDMLGERDWWRVAEDAATGEVVGFGLPSRNPGFPVVGYLGVLPAARGRGHVTGILAEITRVLAEEAGAETVRADTDLANVPMARAFEHVGYRNFARRLVLSAP